MSAGFKVADKVFWGTNGAVEAYVDALATLASARLGDSDPLAAFLREERDVFSMGRVVYLDNWVADDSRRKQLLELLDAATAELLRENTFTDYGRTWVASVIAEMRVKIAG